MNNNSVRFIKTIEVKKLFNLHNYSLTLNADPAISEKLLIFYGDNGCGKTSIMRILFHILAPEDKQGHKSIIASIPFGYISVLFTDKTIVKAYREKEEITGSFKMSVKLFGKKEIFAQFNCVDNEFSVRSTSKENEKQHKLLLNELSKLNLSLYMLSDDRTIHLAAFKPKSSVMYRNFISRDLLLYEDSRVGRQKPIELDPEQISQFLLKQSLRRTEMWIRDKAIIGSSQGESNVNALYSEILKRIINLDENASIDSGTSKKSIEKRVAGIETKCKEFSNYGLLPQFHAKAIMSAVNTAPNKNLGIITNVLNPYLESLEKKLEALEYTYSRIDNFITILNNRFLTNKKISFDLHDGLQILSKNGFPLDESMLSSGERHLLLLFCNSFIAIDKPSLMIIDEPEISLNIKWQRQLLSSLIECVGDSPVQYLFATHSIELLSKHRKNVIKLVS